MRAFECLDGQKYDLPASKYYSAYKAAICQGFNVTKKWVLFLTFNPEGKRVTRTLPLDTEVVSSTK